VSDEKRQAKNVALIGGDRTVRNHPPILKCPLCGTVNLVTLKPFEKNMGAPIKTKCHQCGGDIFMMVLLLGNTDLQKLNAHLQLLIDATNEAATGQRSSLILPKGFKH
jgi:hypothetical protein